MSAVLEGMVAIIYMLLLICGVTLFIASIPTIACGLDTIGLLSDHIDQACTRWRW